MYLELSSDTVVAERDIIGIFDLDNATVMKNTRDYISKAEKNGQIESATFDLPKSFTVTAAANDKKSQTVFISKFSPTTLIKRIGQYGK